MYLSSSEENIVTYAGRKHFGSSNGKTHIIDATIACWFLKISEYHLESHSKQPIKFP